MVLGCILYFVLAALSLSLCPSILLLWSLYPAPGSSVRSRTAADIRPASVKSSGSRVKSSGSMQREIRGKMKVAQRRSGNRGGRRKSVMETMMVMKADEGGGGRKCVSWTLKHFIQTPPSLWLRETVKEWWRSSHTWFILNPEDVFLLRSWLKFHIFTIYIILSSWLSSL